MPDMNVSVPAPVTPVPGAPSPTSTTPVVSDVKNISPDKSGDTKELKEVKAAIEKIKLKSGDYSTDEIESLIEKAKGADKKFLEASKAKKEAIRFFQMAKQNPREFLAKTGLDPKKFAYDEVAEDIKNKLRDPKEVELEAAQKRLKEYEEKEAAATKSAAAARMDREAKAMEAKFHSEIIEALEATPTLPKNGFTVAKIAKYIDVVRDKTGQLLSAKDVVGVIERDIRGEVKGMLTNAKAEQLIELIGEEGMAAIRKFDLSRIKNPLNGGTSSTTATGEPAKAKKYKNSHEYWRAIDDAAKNLGGQ